MVAPGIRTDESPDGAQLSWSHASFTAVLHLGSTLVSVSGEKYFRDVSSVPSALPVSVFHQIYLQQPVKFLGNVMKASMFIKAIFD